MKDVFAALRMHIVAIAVCATITFGYVFRGAYPVGLALLCGFDWCIVNLLNRATDVEEDRKNDIAATEFVARHARLLVLGSLVALVGSLVAGFLVLPRSLAAVRVLFHVLGLGYSFRYVPTPRGLRRFKDLYVAKNSMSAAMFILSVVGYPLLGVRSSLTIPVLGVCAVTLYFFLFEHTFEIIYDMRDLPGDRAVSVPTYPVVHGLAISTWLVQSLAITSVAVLLLARLAGWVGTREVLMVAAPLMQLAFLARRGAENVTRADCIGITYGGAVLLLFYLAGTFAWTRAGLPTNF